MEGGKALKPSRLWAKGKQAKPKSRRYLLWTFAVAMALWLSLFFVDRALAIEPPDSDIGLPRIDAYDGVLVSGDLLIVVEYDVPYASLPLEVISDAYIGRFRRGSTELQSVEPFAFNDRGYGPGVFSFYWDATAVSTDSIEFENTNSESYTITLQGKVGVFSGSVPSATAVASQIQGQDATTTLTGLRARVVALAQQFENDTDWNDDPAFDDLIGTSGGITQLTTVGAEYFATAIPNLHLMVQDIFSSGVSTPDFTEADYNPSLERDLNDFWAGNWIDDFFQSQADLLRVPKRTLTSLIALFFMGLIALFIRRLLEDSSAHATAFGVSTMAVTLPMAAAVGLIPLQLTVVVAFLGLLAIGWSFTLAKGL